MTISVQVLGCATYMQSFCFRGLSLLPVNSPVGIYRCVFSLWHYPFPGFTTARIFTVTFLNQSLHSGFCSSGPNAGDCLKQTHCVFETGRISLLQLTKILKGLLFCCTQFWPRSFNLERLEEKPGEGAGTIASRDWPLATSYCLRDANYGHTTPDCALAGKCPRNYCHQATNKYIQRIPGMLC